MNPFTTTSARVAKLLLQYKQHGSIIIGVDFDFTIYDPVTDTMHLDIIILLLQAEQLNCKLCLWTANASRLPDILHRCKDVGLDFQWVNKSPIHIENEVVKPHFNLLLDDTAGLGQSIEILTQVLRNLNEH